jgi:hypothetical protein
MMNQAIADAKFLRAQLDALAGQSIREFIESKGFVIAPVHRACLFSDEEHEGELSLLLTNLTHTQRLDKREAERMTSKQTSELRCNLLRGLALQMCLQVNTPTTFYIGATGCMTYRDEWTTDDRVYVVTCFYQSVQDG